MTTIVVIFKILFLVLIAHCCCWLVAAAETSPLAAESDRLKIRSHRETPTASVRQQPDDSAADSSSVLLQKFIQPPPITTSSPFSAASSQAPNHSESTSVGSINININNNNDEDDEVVGRTREQSLAISGHGGGGGSTSAGANKLLSARVGQLTPAADSGETDPAAEDGNGERPTKTTTATARSRDEHDEEDVNYAELCYLSNGGSSLTLTVNEATPVGTVIGTIEVNGDPALEGGNVDLFDDANASSLHSDGSLATPSAASRAGGNHSRAEQTSLASASSSQQARHLAQRIQRLLGKRSTIGFQDQPIGATAGMQEASRQSQALLVAASQPPAASGQRQQPNNNNHRTIGSIRDNKQRARDSDGKVAATMQPPPQAQPQPNSSFYTLLGVGQPATPSQPAPAAAAVRLEPGTRNLILVRALDKESPEGEQSLLIQIRCSARRAQGGGGGGGNKEITTIPVRIIVTDANDHAPEFLGPQPFVVNISETTPIETVVLRDLEAVDRDSAGPFSTIHYRVLDDPAAAHSSWLQFANPLVPNLVVAHQLDYETQASFQLTIIASDEGEPEPLWSSAQVQVNIIDFDDQNPRFLDEKYTLLMDEIQQNLVGQNLQILPRNLRAEDGDQGINAPIHYSFDQLTSGLASAASITQPELGADPILSATSAANQQQQQQFNVNHYLHLNPSSGEIRLLRQWPSRLNALASPMTLVVRATQADNKDRYTLTTLTVTTTAARSFPSSSVAASSSTAASSSSSSSSSSSVSSSFAAHNETHAHRQRSQGIEFEPSQLSVRVPESAPINEKIARVRARYIQQQQQQPPANLAHATDEPAANQTGPDQAVDVVQPAELRRPTAAAAASTAAPARQLLAVAAAANQERRPINYQILDDQTDQFGINGLGEIFIKRQLDYEQRQEFRIRVLATYLKYSDICRVHVEVLNINDNKPKFTQPQYTFHITESRLRSNFIGQVQAHDADLNDTVRYSLSGEQAHLFNIHPSTGQVSVRSSIKQLNMTSCQLIVIATDSLGQKSQQQQFSHQARLNLQIAPQLVGRSINFGAAPGADSKLFSSRSLTETPDGGSGHSATEEWLTSPAARQTKPGASKEGRDLAVSNQRSSVATVMASLQHMAKSVSFFDMPMSSALLLSALLAFLICLLFILLVSMSVHIYRRQLNKSLNRRRHHQQQHLAATAHIRHAHLASANQLLALAAAAGGTPPSVAAQQPALARYLQQSPSTSSNPSTNTTPAASSGQSPPGSLHQQQQQAPKVSPTQATGRKRLTAKVSPAAHTLRPASALSAARLSQTGGPVSLEPLETLSAQLQQRRAAQQQLLLQMQQQQRPPMANNDDDDDDRSPQMSMISSGRRSKHSYRSTEDDDDDASSSVMQCGHYSVNASFGRPAKPQQQKNGKQQQSFSANERCQDEDHDGRQLVRHNSNDNSNDTGGQQGERRARDVEDNEDDHDDGSPGIKSYRKLPANLGSLARPQAGKFSFPAQSEPHSSKSKLLASTTQTTQDSAIASDESSSSSSRDRGQHQQLLDELQRGEPDIRVPSPPLCRTGNLIRWPLGSVPQRVKKLTWDDELSQQSNPEADVEADGECYVAPDYESQSRRAPGINKYREQEVRMLFSPDPGSPAPQMSASQLLAANAGSQLDSASLIGQNNCFDYTIVESSQCQVQETFSSLVNASLSAQHHYLQQQQQLVAAAAARLPPLTKTTSYMYSSDGSFQDGKRIPTSINQAYHHPPNNQHSSNDLITTAVL